MTYYPFSLAVSTPRVDDRSFLLRLDVELHVRRLGGSKEPSSLHDIGTFLGGQNVSSMLCCRTRSDQEKLQAPGCLGAVSI
jgi:hypothetical protein